MKNALLIVCLIAGISSCKKDKFTTAPQIEFIDISPNTAASDLTSLQKDFAPKLTLRVRDAEGDFGSLDTKDSSMIYVKHLLTNGIDSFRFPNLDRAPKNNFDAEVSINLFEALECMASGPVRPRVDTIFYEVYITDAKRNKSNVIKTGKPVLFLCK